MEFSELSKSCQKFMEKKIISGKAYDNIMCFLVEDSIPECWNQPIIFCGNTIRLCQINNGPCGFLSAIQANLLLQYIKKPNKSRKYILYSAICKMMRLLGDMFILVTDIDEKRKKIEYCSEKTPQKFVDLIKDENFFEKPNALVLLALSFVIQAGPAFFLSYSFHEPLINSEGYTSMRFVTALIFFTPVDSLEDGFRILGTSLQAGCYKEQKIGVMTVCMIDDQQIIGQKVLEPRENIWILHYGGHYTCIRYEDNKIYEYNNILDSADEYIICSHLHPFYDLIKKHASKQSSESS